jgi:putative membrane protein
MQDLAKHFLSATEKEQIIQAVQAAESKTAGEIVPMVVSSSYHYPMADMIAAVTLALPSALLATPLIGARFWLGTWNLWVFLGLFTLLFVVLQELVKRVLPLKRWFIARREIDAEVEEAATVAFYEQGLYRTRDETGVLIFISVFEHRVWVLADRGINAKVDQAQWDHIVSHIAEGVKQRRQAKAICEAVSQIGDLLADHFPRQADDTDELQSLIVDT